MTLTLPYPPLLNKYYGHKVLRVRGRHVPSVFVSREGQKYKLHAKLLARSLGIVPVPKSREVCLWIQIYRPRKSGDIDGPLKCLLDALEGALYVNDSQIVGLYVDRFDDKNKPRVEVEIDPR